MPPTTKATRRRQVTFDALTEPTQPLDDNVVLVDDPRWWRCLDELLTAPYCGLDTEGFSDGVTVTAAADDDLTPTDPDLVRDFDPFAATMRLIQVALPSGRVMVADLGGIGDDRKQRLSLYGDDGETVTRTIDGVSVTVPVYRPGSFFERLRDFVESPTRQKVLHHAKFDALWLRIAFGWRMRCIRCTMLLSQLYWAGLRGVRHGLGHLSERAVAMRAPGVWVVEKRLQKSEWRWKLSQAQLNYAARDAVVVVAIWKWLSARAKEDGMLGAAVAEMAAIPAFVECEFNGLPVNPAMLDDHIEAWKRGRELAIEPFRARYPGVDPAKNTVVAVALSQDDCYPDARNGNRPYVFYELDHTKPRRRPLFILGQRFDVAFAKKNERYTDENDHSVGEAVLTKYSSLPWISALLDWRSMGVVIKWMENVRRRLRRDARVRGEYAQIAGGEGRNTEDEGVGKGMGRSACAQPSLQQSANPQPKLSKLVAAAMGWTQDVVMSPRIPFVPHDENAAAYLRWAVARLRGEADDPFAYRGGEAARDRVVVVEGWDAEYDDDEAEAVPTTDADSPSVADRIAWYESLAAKWEQQPRGLVVGDFSQAHMRIAAQASQDPQLLEDFRLDRDAHLKLAYDFGVATKQVHPEVPIDDFFKWYSKGHPKFKFVKSLRGPAKTGNYTRLNLGSVTRLKQAGDTAKPPISLSKELWQIIRDAWDKRYAGLLGFQKAHIKRCNKIDVVVDGEHYGAAWSLKSGRRLWLRKEVDKYDRGEVTWCAGCGKTHGRLTVKGTDAVALVWMGSEACSIKRAMGDILSEFDSHDVYFMARGLAPVSTVWDAKFCNMAHDEINSDSKMLHVVAVAGCVRRHFRSGLEWGGLTDVPVESRDAKDTDLVVRSWADK